MQQDFGKLSDLANALLPWAIGLTVIIAAMAIGVYALGKWRDRGDDDQVGPGNQLTKFREMHERGELSDEEFRTIKTQLATQLQAKVSDSDETG